MTETTSNQSIANNDASHGVSFREAFWVWLKIASLSFGGPA